MKNNRLSLVLKGSALVLAVSLFPGCKLSDMFKKTETEPKSAETKVDENISLCSIDGKSVISKGDFDKRVIQMLQANPYFRGAGPEMLPLNVKRKFLDRLVEEELFVKNADKENLQNNAEFQKTLKEMIDLVTRSLKIQFSEKKIYDSIEVSAEQSKKDFEANKERYVKVAGGVLTSGVKFDTDDAATAFLAKAKANIKGFENLAKQSKSGKFREFGRISKESAGMGMEAAPAPIKEAVLALHNLPAVEKVKVGKEIWVVKASDKKDSVYFDFDEVKPQVEATIKNNEFRNKLTSEIAKLKSEYKVTINEDFFAEKKPVETAQTGEAGAPADVDGQGEEAKAEAQPQQAPQAA